MTAIPTPDEKLMALADGELHGEEARELRTRFASDPELAARYALFVETRALVQKSVSNVSSATSDPLTETIIAIDRSMQDGDSDNGRPRLSVIQGTAGVRDHRMDVSTRRVGAPARWRLPAAAALLFVLGGVAGYVLAPGTRLNNMSPTSGILVMPAAQAALDRALAGTASGEEVAWSDRTSGLSGRILIVSTHQLDDGTVCREYQIGAGERGRGTIVGASCRREGQWQTEIAVTAPGAGSTYTPASGMSVIDDYLSDRGSRGPLAAEYEGALIKQGWQAQRN
jgi:hypothetical protein